MNEQNTPGPTAFAERLHGGHFVITAEVAPPVSCDADDLRRKAAPLKGLVDAVNITDGAGARASMGALAAASILHGMGIEPILQITCRDKNRIALQAELMGAAALGIRNLLLLTGDDPKAGDQPDTKPVFDVDSKTLLETARRLRDEATLPTGRAVGGKAAFFLGAAAVPIYRTPNRCSTLTPRRSLKPRAGCATRRHCPPAARSAARLRSSSARPTCRSTRRPAGNRTRSRARQNPVRNSCRPSSAWMRPLCAVTSACWQRPD